MATETETLPPTQLITDTTLTFPDLPPFPTNIPTAPLHRLSLGALRTSSLESTRLFSASKDLGFFYLDLRDDVLGERLLREGDALFAVGEKLYELGREELQQYDYKHLGSYMGYKGYGSAVVDEEGNLDRNEFYNMPKDDFLGLSKTPLAHPPLLYEHAESIRAYMHDAHKLVLLILTHLNTHLGLPPDTLASLHRQTANSGDQVRIVKSPPQPASDMRTALGKHTDYGSITILFNRLGGLQILPPPSLVPAGQEPQWTYVKPLRGHCIVNLGDAMVKFTNGLLKSNIHRVINPPGEQAQETRYSLVYFARPEDEVVLKRLEGSEIIPPLEEGVVEEQISSKKWIEWKALRLRKVEQLSEIERKKLWDESGLGK
ncbi:clavaminate synthase-like protein [Coleophoma crateriformis]|uniref:Clavaminate synthase-like protein n=1 Tax=Coleophoma crateriformis TaxID=565419 RepID=A0A3D8QY71_9HELO|nr:clavaminate synthase-like protein [Coleophoma crateriformis]